ncbi:6272_t:CDS:2, partial [Acaulospora morrowiae]
EISKPQVIISDRYQALMHAIRIIFPESQNFLCVWHIEKNILTNCRNQFPTDEEWIEFLGNWITVITKVSIFALKKVHKQLLKVSCATLENPLQPCSGTFTSSMGLPYIHKIQERLINNQYLQLTNFHQHWWLQECQLLPQIPNKTEDPLQQQWQEYEQIFDTWPIN